MYVKNWEGCFGIPGTYTIHTRMFMCYADIINRNITGAGPVLGALLPN